MSGLGSYSYFSLPSITFIVDLLGSFSFNCFNSSSSRMASCFAYMVLVISLSAPKGADAISLIKPSWLVGRMSSCSFD
jgi:hypothetical protein